MIPLFSIDSVVHYSPRHTDLMQGGREDLLVIVISGVQYTFGEYFGYPGLLESLLNHSGFDGDESIERHFTQEQVSPTV